MRTSPRQAIIWKAHDSISALPSGWWNEKVARSDITKCEELIRLHERHATDERFLCLVAYLEERIAACAFFTLFEVDLAAHLPGSVASAIHPIRWAFPTFLFRHAVSAGIRGTDGEHWWYDASYWGWQEFFSDLNREFRRLQPRADWIILRSYVLDNGPLTDAVRSLYAASGFVERDEVPAAIVTLGGDVITEEDYLRTLNPSHRDTIRNALRTKKKFGLQYEEIADPSNSIDEIYPLYLATCRESEELSTTAVSKAYLDDLSREKSLCPCILVVRDRDGKAVSFGMTVENDSVLSLCFVGMDGTASRDKSLIYHTCWQAIARAIRKQVRHVDLGMTMNVAKQTFGADFYPTKSFVRTGSRVIDYVWSRLERSQEGWG